jgi:ParB family chromosome partitioning protein
MSKITNFKIGYEQVDVKRIVVNPEQPRIIFREDEMQELADSIREHGVIEPIVVEACEDDYMLHDGERRWRAAVMAGLLTIPAIVTPPLNGTGPRERLERALVANVQRAEMHPIEEGLGYQRLITEFGYGLKQVAKRIGKHYTRIHYCLGLLRLDAEIQQLMLERKLPCEQRAAEALLSVTEPTERVQLAKALAEHNATAKMMITACHRFNLAKGGLSSRKKQKGSPAIRMIKEDKPEWDALYQLGKVPPWPAVNDAVMSTCDLCPLRKMASDSTCSDCALVIFLQRAMEAKHGN